MSSSSFKQATAVAALTAAVFAGAGAQARAADSKADLNAELKAFQANSLLFMNEHPQKYDAITGKPIETSLFSASEIASKDYVTMKAEERGERFDLDTGRSVYLSNDLAQNLVDNLKYTSLEAMEHATLMSAAVPNPPWSDTYWPIYEGVIADRFADPSFPGSPLWRDNVNYVLNTPLANVNQLSPAEKYDMLVGDSDKTLTKFMLNVGQGYVDDHGIVADWMGICNGWSPASIMLPRPTKTVDLMAADGQTKITFYPSDVKALGSALWAYSNPQVRFVGSRCDIKNPATDENGRIIDQACFDTNPGTWHMAVVNQLGVAKRSFVIDATYDYEVWNQPVYSYSYTYFNPKSGEAVNSIAEGKVQLKDYTNDKFAKYRGANSVSVVGISMTLTYVAETLPSDATSDSPLSDRRVDVHYLYDLELDANNNIVGGEWYQNAHPDFMWTPARGQKALSIADESLSSTWNSKVAVPQEWRSAAPAASREGEPIGKIVEEIFSLAK
jgi:hypothetical protein